MALILILIFNPCRFLALVCLLRDEVFERQGLIEYNFHCFREAIQEVRFLPPPPPPIRWHGGCALYFLRPFHPLTFRCLIYVAKLCLEQILRPLKTWHEMSIALLHICMCLLFILCVQLCVFEFIKHPSH